LAPVLPFLTEHFNLKLGKSHLATLDMQPSGSSTSIHCKEFDSIDTNLNTQWVNYTLVAQSTYLLKVLDMIRSLRGNLPRKKPIKKAILKVLPQMFDMLDNNQMSEFICNETNILDLEVQEFKPSTKTYTVRPNFPILGSKSKQYGPIIKSFTQEQISQLVTNKLIQINGLEIDISQVIVDVLIPSDISGMVCDSNDELQLGISMDLTQDEQTNLVYIGKCIAREYQQLRKESGLHPWDPVQLHYLAEYELSQTQLDIITKSTSHTPNKIELLDSLNIIGTKQIEILNYNLSIYLSM